MFSIHLNNGKFILKINLKKKSKFYNQTMEENTPPKLSIHFVLTIHSSLYPPTKWCGRTKEFNFYGSSLIDVT